MDMVEDYGDETTQDVEAVEAVTDLEGRERSVRLAMTLRRWMEARPYGLGSAFEPMCDVVDGSQELSMDGQPTGRDELAAAFGAEAAKALLDRLDAKAE